MSYDIELRKDGELVRIPRHEEGGIYILGGTTEAQLNITYNYSPCYYKHLDGEQGIRWLYGKTGVETIARLEATVATLGTERNTEPFWGLVWERPSAVGDETWQRWLKIRDWDEHTVDFKVALAAGAIRDGGAYWKPTEGNAGYALNILLGWARMHPEAVWTGD